VLMRSRKEKQLESRRGRWFGGSARAVGLCVLPHCRGLGEECALAAAKFSLSISLASCTEDSPGCEHS